MCFMIISLLWNVSKIADAYVIGTADFLALAVVEPGLEFRPPGRQFRHERHLFRIGRHRAAGIDASDLHACLGNGKRLASREPPKGVRMDRQTGGNRRVCLARPAAPAAGR